MVDHIKSNRDEIQCSDEEVVVNGLLWLGVDAPQDTYHPMKIELPRPRKGDSHVEQISSTEVHLMQEIVLVDANAQELIALVVAELDVIALASLYEGIE